jgi:hypothetical protein
MRYHKNSLVTTQQKSWYVLQLANTDVVAATQYAFRIQAYKDPGESPFAPGTSFSLRKSIWKDKFLSYNLPNPSSRTLALESTQPLTEMSTRNLLEE